MITTFQFNHKTGLIKLPALISGLTTTMNLNLILDTGASSIIRVF